MAHLVTGHAGTEHIKPSDDGAFNAGVVGAGKYVLDLGNKFAYEIVSNNLVKILDGELVNQGRHMNIPVNNYEEVTIENGLQSVKRYDLICMRYTKNADTNIETAELVVVKGTSSTNPSDPVCEEGNILEGALVDDFPLYRVRLDGLNIEGVDCLFEVIPNMQSMRNDIKAANDTAKLLYDGRSHIGMVIHSTTLDTAEKVKAIYGGTTWAKIEGRFLLGQSSSYAINSTGGAATVALAVANLPSHNHSVGAHSHGAGTLKANSNGAHTHDVYRRNGAVVKGSDYAAAQGTDNTYETSSAGAHEHSISGSTANSAAFNSGLTGSGTAHNNMPPYKTVYIWERTA